MEQCRVPSVEPSNLQPRELLQIAANFFDAHHVAYRVVGSMASIAYGEIRFTNDVDIVAALELENVDDLCDHFTPPNYDLARHAVEDAIRRRFQFNIIHIPAGLKLDIMLPKDNSFEKVEQGRAIRLSDSDGFSAVFSSPEDVILNKLVFYQLGESEKHLRDIAGILRVKSASLDETYLEHWAESLNVLAEWRLAKQYQNKRSTS